jgi:N-carbamoylputrescine amidase
MKTIKVAVGQINCVDGDVNTNLQHASSFVEEAGANGTELLLFPEFMPQGYRLTNEIWNTAEPFDSITTNWLCENAKYFNMFIGTTFLEAKNGHFFNTFAMAAPSGKIVGTVRKMFPSMWEAYFFKGYSGEHVFETDMGRVGVGICFDNHTYKIATRIKRGLPDIVLMPHSYCTPTVSNQLTSMDDINRLKILPQEVAKLYNKVLGVPIVLCNKSGNWNSPVPNKLLGEPKDFSFSGKSMIINGNGSVLCELDEKESVGLGIINLTPISSKNNHFPKHSRYIYPGPFGREFLRLMEFMGYLSYTFNSERKEISKKIVN